MSDEAKFIGLIIIILIIMIHVFIAKEFRFAAAEKGYDDIKYFWWSFFLGPVGWFMVIALPAKNAYKILDFDESDIPDI